uniref:Uncharacterized protein n=1 Tax=Fundulus heteroclitus TaxID=8078 RepID=A0A3Q2P1B9_FUNHE
MSKTFTNIVMLPDLAGVPPSMAVMTVSLMVGCFSRSRAFCSTSSADTLSSFLWTSKEKYSFRLSLYVLTLFFATS